MTDDRRAPLRRLAPHELDEHQRAVYDAIIGSRRSGGPQRFRLTDDDGRLEGPFNAFLLQPALGDRLQALGSAIRFSTSLTDRAREIAILVVAAHWRSEFEQFAHEPIGRAAGLTDDELAVIRRGATDDIDPAARAIWADPADRLVVHLAQSLVRDGDVDDDTYAAAIDQLGEAGLFEVLTLVGYYAALALQLRVFRVELPLPTESE
jgi:4-carboxymuconolactone decarboxylase